MPALNGWHRGERAIHEKLGYQKTNATAFAAIEGDMPEQHREFYATRLPFLPVTVLDETGRPWGSILAGADGKPGFINSPKDTILMIDAHVWEGDPILDSSQLFKGKEGMLVAGIGVEFSTRRRNKFAGHITDLVHDRSKVHIQISVNETIGNCPKYITIRDLAPHPKTSPNVTHRQLHLSPGDRLPEDVTAFILDSDTVFVGTSYIAPKEDERMFPSHVGMNQRGGRRGFLRVMPSDNRTIILPDYSGNRLMTSLGNIEATPVAALTFVSFTTGDILYLTGDAKTLVGPSAQKIMPLQNAVTMIQTTGYVLVRDALPVRQRHGSRPLPSPYSPPIRYLVGESTASVYFDSGPEILATLSEIHILSPSLATFSWECSRDVTIKPGQAIIMDFTSFLGPENYYHMAPGKPTAVNDDRIRTWTVSSSHPTGSTRSFDLTMREKPGGAVTGALFSIARKLAEMRPELLHDLRQMQISVKVVEITGEFGLPVVKTRSTLTWFAGGIGITPFLSMLSFLGNQDLQVDSNGPWNIHLVLSTREPQVLLPLILAALPSDPMTRGINLTLDVFSNDSVPEQTKPGVLVNFHKGRLDIRSFLASRLGCREDGKFYICGPVSFESSIIAGLTTIGVNQGNIHREGFSY